MKTLKMLSMKPGESVPTERELNYTDYKDIQACVGGLMEFFELVVEGHSYDIIFNEEGKLRQMPPTLALSNNQRVFDYIAGDLIILKADEEGDTVGLDDEDVKRITNYFACNKMRTFLGVYSLPTYDIAS